MSVENQNDALNLEKRLLKMSGRRFVDVAFRWAIRILPLYMDRLDCQEIVEAKYPSLLALRCLMAAQLATLLEEKSLAELSFHAMRSVAEHSDTLYFSGDPIKGRGHRALAFYFDQVAKQAGRSLSYDNYFHPMVDFPNGLASIIPYYYSDAISNRKQIESLCLLLGGEFFEDVLVIEGGEDLNSVPLWRHDEPVFFKVLSDEILLKLNDRKWDFWRRWWDGAKSGNPLNPDLQLAIVQELTEDDWSSPEKAAVAIARIEARFESETEPVDRQLSLLAPADTSDVEKLRASMVAHRRDLPPTLDALLGFISLEIERLQSRNYRDEEDAVEAQRQIRILLTIHDTVSRLPALVPETDQMPIEDAEKAEKLTRLFLRKYSEWPRSNADELVDNSYRIALIGAVATVLPMLKIDPTAALAAGLCLFGSKRMVEMAKAAKDFSKS